MHSSTDVVSRLNGAIAMLNKTKRLLESQIADAKQAREVMMEEINSLQEAADWLISERYRSINKSELQGEGHEEQGIDPDDEIPF